MVNDNLTNLFKRPITFETECMSLLGWPGRRQLVQLEHCTNSHPRSFVIFGVTRRSRCDGRHSLTYWLTRLLSVSTDLTDVTLWVMIPIDDLTDVTLQPKILMMKMIKMMKIMKKTWLMWPRWVMIPIEGCLLIWKLTIYESFLVMKTIQWWKLSSAESYQVVKVILWWKLSCDKIYLVMKVILWWK